ncbi:hypothetical protein R3P38DRAFT_1121802 [Favolaschia claudopus]|uniref:Transmembrane protein n=1 Tax=Favolaschia claudopus TaxID=2862362 RepID=A0AAW0BBQ8_9AGAR
MCCFSITMKWLQLPAFLFDPVIRVWNLRLAILLSVIYLYLVLPVVYEGGLEGFVFNRPSLLVSAPCIILIHHVLILFPCPLNGTAVMDLCIFGPELFFEIHQLYVFAHLLSRDSGSWRLILWMSISGMMLLLSVGAAMARVGTIVKDKHSFIRQRFVFLGGCRKTRPHYTLVRIFLGRAIARPLVRGESTAIAIARAIIVAVIALGVPTMAVYWILIAPTTAQIYTKFLGSQAVNDARLPLGPLSIFVLLPNSVIEPYPSLPSMLVNVTDNGERFFLCTTTNYTGELENEFVYVECPSPDLLPLVDIFKITILARIPKGNSVARSVQPIYVVVTCGTALRDLLTSHWIYSTGVLMFPDSHLVAGYTWIRRDQISPPYWGIPSPPSTLFTIDVNSIQPDTSVTDPELASLTLYQEETGFTRILADTVDATALTGISTFGGFWTFLDGAFAVFFGANVLYFMFGRRPMTALGIAHIFQRGALIRQWNQDFPAIRTEGGLPGSANAGIVAFIRDRLVDLDTDPRNETDIEAQNLEIEAKEQLTETFQHSSCVEDDVIVRPRSARGEIGYMLDELPLLDIDLGLRDNQNLR